MKVLLQHVLTSYYLCDGGGWSKDSSEAFDFGHSQRAIDYSRLNHLYSARLAIRFTDSESDALFTIPPSGMAQDALQLTEFN